MYYTVYKITNNVNDKVYIGKHQTKNLQDGYMGSGKLIKRAIAKHGVGNFTKEILHVFDTEQEMNKKEAEIVTEDFCAGDNYNICCGGQGGFGYINSKGLSGTKAGVAARMAQSPEWRSEVAKRAARTSVALHSERLSAQRKEVYGRNRDWMVKSGPNNQNSKKVVDHLGQMFDTLTAYGKCHGITAGAAGCRLKRGDVRIMLLD